MTVYAGAPYAGAPYAGGADTAGLIDVRTVTTNDTFGIGFVGRGYVTSNPPVVTPPATIVRGYDYMRAFHYTAPTMSNGRPVDLSSLAQFEKKAADRTRLVVGGKDVTYFRDIQTPIPRYSLTQPHAYGSTTLTFPQIHAAFEQPGDDGLRWLKKEKEVRIQRVNAAGAVVGTDYVGVITAVRAEGRNWVADVGGQVRGRASLVWNPLTLVRRTPDIGDEVYAWMVGLGLRFTPRFGPTTGIRLTNAGGTWVQERLDHLCSQAVEEDGSHWTTAPTAADVNVWEFRKKDTTTKHATVYFDDAHVVANLIDDLAEQPNRIFGSGVTPEGMKVKNGIYEGLRQGPAAPYPMAAGAPFGLGTVDADTLSGDGITILTWRLRIVNYIDREENGPTYTARIVRAVKALQDDAGLPVNGIMDPDTWNALYDLSVVGYSLRQAQVMPMAERLYVKPWFRTANGSRIRRNPAYRRHRLKVDQPADYGAGHEKQQMVEWSKRTLERAATSANWVGTVTVNTGAVIRGEHTPGTPVTEANVMDVRELRAGMNVWAPLFDGGTLLHVVGIDVDPARPGQPRTATLTVDTQYRDLLTVAQIIARDRESRTDPARAFINSHRSSKGLKDSLITWDEMGGEIFDVIECPADEWTVFPMVAGQEGTIRRVSVQTVNSPAAFVMSMWALRPGPKALKQALGNPFLLTEDGESVWEQDHPIFERRLLLEAWGDEEQPCGYWPKKHTGPQGNTTTHPITGDFRQDAQISFHTFDRPVLWIGIYPDRDTTIRPQKMAWVQLEEGS